MPATPQRRKPQPPAPDHFLIGRRTFFDIGPPFEFYEILSVRAAAHGGTLVERIQVTPPGDVCTQAATVEVATGSINESVADLLAGTNPCSIPEKDLRRELKRCKKCLVFSGADIVMQVKCGENRRYVYCGHGRACYHGGRFAADANPLGSPVDFDVRGLGRRLPRTETPEVGTGKSTVDEKGGLGRVFPSMDEGYLRPPRGHKEGNWAGPR